MPSQARARFDENKAEVDRLLEVHETITQGVQGRHHKLEALNKSVIIMLCACWEAYVEDVALEMTRRLLERIDEPSRLPEGLRRKIADSLGKESTSLWRLAGEGWKAVAIETVTQLCDGLSGGMNTPNTHNVNQLFRTALGVNVADNWAWQRMSNDRARAKLNELVRDRGALAHGRKDSGSVRKSDCTYYIGHVSRLVTKTDECLVQHLRTFRRRRRR